MSEIPPDWENFASEPEIRALIEHHRQLLGQLRSKTHNSKGKAYTHLTEQAKGDLGRIREQVAESELKIKTAIATTERRRRQESDEKNQRQTGRETEETRHRERTGLDRFRNFLMIVAIAISVFSLVATFRQSAKLEDRIKEMRESLKQEIMNELKLAPK